MNGRQEGTTAATPEEGARSESPTGVPARANRDGETAGPADAWSWVEPTLWTPRMVQALVDGVKGGKWYSLWDKIIALRTLEAAFAKVKANDGAAGVDHVSVEAFERDKERNLRCYRARRLRSSRTDSSMVFARASTPCRARDGHRVRRRTHGTSVMDIARHAGGSPCRDAHRAVEAVSRS